jgi:hypothetical protein
MPKLGTLQNMLMEKVDDALKNSLSLNDWYPTYWRH